MPLPPLRAGLEARQEWVRRWKEEGKAAVGSACPTCWQPSDVIRWGDGLRGTCACDPPDTVTLPEVLQAHDLQGIIFTGTRGEPVG